MAATQLCCASIEKARSAFPTGLVQPAGSYRFGADALLLAAFAARIFRKRSRKIAQPLAVEAGSGSGAALLAFAMLEPQAKCFGIELLPELVAAARANAASLATNTEFFEADLRNLEASPASGLLGQVTLIFANPPWHKAGRISPNMTKAMALHGDMAIFCAAAAQLLAWHGYFCLILPPQLLCNICAMFNAKGFGLRLVLPLASHSREKAKRLLLMARKGACAEPTIAAPLILHDNSGHFTRDALEFCPWLEK